MEAKADELRTRCRTCGTPATRKTIVIGSDGKCNVCSLHELRRIPAFRDALAGELDQLIERVRGQGSEYDCLVPLSGGKDSVFVLYFLSTRYDLRILAFTVDTGTVRPLAYENMRRAVQLLDVDWEILNLDLRVLGQLMRYSLDMAGSLGWGADGAVAASSMNRALQLGIPLVMFSHGLAEYAAYPGRTLADAPERVDHDYFANATSGISVLQMADALHLDANDSSLLPYHFPAEDQLTAEGVQGRFLSSYIDWDERAQAAQIGQALGWRAAPQEGVPAEYSYEKMDCDLVGSIDYLRNLTQGYNRLSHILANEARNGRGRRATAAVGRDTDPARRPRSLSVVLSIMQIDEAKFVDYANRHRLPGVSGPLAP